MRRLLFNTRTPSLLHLPQVPGPAECAERFNPPPLSVDRRWRVRSKAQVRKLRSQNLRSLNPPHISPQRPRAFRRADPQRARGRFSWFRSNASLAIVWRAKLVDDGPWFDFAFFKIVYFSFRRFSFVVQDV